MTNSSSLTYSNMDFIIFSALMGVLLPWIFITYDIGCQWSKNFRRRMANFPEHMHIDPETKVQVAIPSWHINGHAEGCRKDFCLGYTKGQGGHVERKSRLVGLILICLRPV